MIRSRRRAPFLLLLASIACGPSADAAPETQAETTGPATPAPLAAPVESALGTETLGTIEATVDGEARTWYVVTGSVRGEPYSSALWFETADGRLMASIGGYDTADLPFDSFETEGAPGVSFGDYEGSTFAVTLMPEARGAYTLTLSDERPSLTYAPVAGTDISGVYFVQSGTLTVTRLEIEGDRLHAEGTFEGTLSTMEGVGSVRMTDGRFSVQGVPPRSAVAGGG